MTSDNIQDRSKNSEDNPDARFYTPPNVLRQKAGHGGFDPVLIKKADEFLESHDYYFPEIATGILSRLEKAIKEAKEAEVADKEYIDRISESVMELKANGAMFHYPLVSDIANILLNFLENIEELNNDGLNIIDVHQKTLDVIIKNELSGDVGTEGHALASELNQACRRYRKKYSIILDVK